MRIVFSGASPLTIMTAKTLIKQGHEVVIIDVNKEKLDTLADELDCSFLCGDAASPAILSQAAPAESDFLFCLTSSDEANMLTSVLGRSMGFKRVVTSIEDPAYEGLCQELGLEDIIIPVRTMSRHLDNMVRGLDSVELSTVLRGDARLFTFTAGKDEAVGPADLDLPGKARVLFYYRDDKFQFADNETTFRKGDEIVVLTSSENLPELNERWNPKQVDTND